jgi:hypothetical protein
VADDEVLDEIHQVLRRARRGDDAIAAKREVIAAEYRSAPDPEADIAECLLAAGRRDGADALFAALRERGSDDESLNPTRSDSLRSATPCPSKDLLHLDR